MDNDQAYRRAKKKVEAKLGFYVHLTIYLTINVLIFLGNPAVFPGNFWCFWPWSICLFFHGLGAFKPGSGFKERMIESEMKKSRRGATPDRI